MSSDKTFKEIFEGIHDFFNKKTLKYKDENGNAISAYEKYGKVSKNMTKQLKEFRKSKTGQLLLEKLKKEDSKKKSIESDDLTKFSEEDYMKFIDEHSSSYESEEQKNEDIKIIENRKSYQEKKKDIKTPYIEGLVNDSLISKLKSIANKYSITSSVEGSGQILKEPFIKIRDVLDKDMRADAGLGGDDSGRKGLYANVGYDFLDKNKKIWIVLCFGSDDPSIQDIGGFYEKYVKSKIEEINDDIIKREESNNKTGLCKYEFNYDEITEADFEECFTKKLENILEIYADAINKMEKDYWYYIVQDKPIPTPEEALQKKEKQIIEKLKNDNETKQFSALLFNNNRQIILYGPPGTGKTRLAKKVASCLLGEEVDNLKNDDHFTLVQFHPGYSYSEFVETISMEEKYTNKNMIKNGKFREIAEKAETDKGSFYVLIIDEINRANVSETFGELLYGLEYRSGIPINTSMSPNPLVVPDNLFIIATMNTADRSLQALDYALRRRFVFVPVYSEKPEPKDKKIKDESTYTVKGSDKFFMNGIYNKVKTSIERSCARGVDPQDIMPGVSYFLVNPNGGEPDNYHLKYKLDYELIPLLEEYMKNGMFSKRRNLEGESESLVDKLKNRTFKKYIKEEAGE